MPTHGTRSPGFAEGLDTGLLAALKECLAEQGLEVEAKSHADSIYAGAIGAAIRGAFRYDKLAGLGQLPTCLRRSEAPASRRQEASQGLTLSTIGLARALM